MPLPSKRRFNETKQELSDETFLEKGNAHQKRGSWLIQVKAQSFHRGTIGLVLTTAELRNALSQLLALEEGCDVDWDMVQEVSIRLLGQLRPIEDKSDWPVEIVIPYLTDFHLRRQSSEEQQRQHGLLVGYLRSR